MKIIMELKKKEEEAQVQPNVTSYSSVINAFVKRVT